MPRTRYDRAKSELLAAGMVTIGIGRGGTLARAEPVSHEELQLERGVDRESELYEGLAAWLRKEPFGVGEHILFSEVAVTALPKGHLRAGTEWSHPDVTAVQVIRYEHLPDTTVEVSTFEVKRSLEARSVRGVHEALAQARAAHYANLAVELTEVQRGRDDTRLLGECARFGIGLYELVEGHSTLRREAEPQRPAPREVDALIRDFLSRLAEQGRDSYWRTIGRPGPEPADARS